MEHGKRYKHFEAGSLYEYIFLRRLIFGLLTVKSAGKKIDNLSI